MDIKPQPDNNFISKIAYIPFFNLAFLQSDLPIVSELYLKNNLGRDLTDIQCEISTTPACIIPKKITVETLKNGEELALHDLNIKLDYAFISTLAEALKLKLRLIIKNNAEIMRDSEYEITAFPADQWLGAAVMPELLAAFATPNLEVITQLQAIVAQELLKATGSAAIQGYQADKSRVYEICSAIYRAIHSWGIHYANPTANFGSPGQRIRFADTIYQYRLGTCLDTTILFASIMEQCGLHPVIMLQTGHAYIGCHLVERYFPDIPMDDLQTIRKLVDLDEFIVIETVSVTEDGTFAEAEAQARANYLNMDENFHCAIDILRARLSGIRPLPLLRSVNGIEFIPPERQVKELGMEHKRTLQKEVDLDRLENSANPAGRVIRWTQKLLDLSLRNRLLNVRDNRQVIPIVCSDVTLLEDQIAADESLSLNPLANLLSEKDLHNLAMQRNSEVKTEIKQLLDKELAQRRLWTMLSPPEMVRRLTGLYRQSKTDLEEGGVNTLFLAVGFLEWKFAERDERAFLAPILLIPVRLQRKSMAEGIRISRIDEDTVVNETLLEFLRSQFKLTIPGLSPLPTDDCGVDVGMIMQIFRQAIKNMKGWELREEARIGHFSFGKFIMWHDMTARIEALKQNLLVQHLIGGGGVFDDGIEVFPAGEISKYLDLKNLYCPLSADSSQLAAVMYSQQGKSFVLHGPPGTGKSQTITNIIAHNLALGKRVLFVSEKKAALEVVHKRLAAIGLRPFCLELHSSKSGKSEVLAQFAEALNVPETAAAGNWESIVNSLEESRRELNDYVTALHKTFPNGFSAYDCFSRLFKRKAVFPDGMLKIDLLRHSQEDFELLKRLAVDLTHAHCRTTPESIAALKHLATADWSPVWEKDMLAAARSWLEVMPNLKSAFVEVATQLGIPDNDKLERIYNTAVLVGNLKSCGNIPAAFLSDEFQENMEFLNNFTANYLHCKELTEKLHNYHLESLADLDFVGIAERIRGNNQTFFVIRYFRNKTLLKELSGVNKRGGTPLTINELSANLADFESYCRGVLELEKSRTRAELLLGRLWNNGEVDFAALNTTFVQTRQIIDLIGKLAENDVDLKNNLLANLQTILPETEKYIAKDSLLRQKINQLLLAWNDYQEKMQEFAAFAPDLPLVTDFSTVKLCVEQLIDHSGELRNVLIYRKLRDESVRLGLGRFVAALEAGNFADLDMREFFEQLYCGEMINQILVQSPVLCNFTGANQDERIRLFCEFDRKYTQLSKQVIFAKLAAALPRRRSGPCPEGTELGLLKRECEKRSRQKPVRQLLEQIPTLAAILKPCFLMSPLSVAQYLPPDTAPFDLIVFDEASQIPVWDAIGVIARGRQLIVVGDPKQMPPTNFFQKGESDDDDRPLEETEDMESILDECIAAGVHPTYLNWHYRSRHESLISFSNHYYYDDRLFTFPAACSSERLGIRFEFVPNGVYERKLSRTNRKEAEMLVKYVFERLENPKLKQRSIGVVTFSQAQKDLIEDLMEQERVKHPNLEAYFSDQNEEPLFVKNLENVQGDERDVICFSICYAPDAEGKFSMNFGPLNRQGGERRLNVAITRAKEQVVVFSSIHSTQIDLTRTGATGAAHLKYFLDYAEKGLHVQVKNSTGKLADGLIDTIADFLVERGFAVERAVGCSGYQIDLAVRNPERSSEFMLGIECDGIAYAAQKTTRDRDNLRNSVLHNLGWHTFRAWSVDWTFDRKRAEEKLLSYIEKVRTGPEMAEEEPLVEKIFDVISPEPEMLQSQTPKVSEHRREYHAWINTENLSQETFYDLAARNKISSQMREIIQQEGPICETLLKKRVVKAWGFTRAGEKIQNTLDFALPAELAQTQIGVEKVFWPSGVAVDSYLDYRIPADENSKRTMEEIPPEELANAMQEILLDFSSCELDTLYRETVKLFGFSAVTAKARKYLDLGMKSLQQSGRV